MTLRYRGRLHHIGVGNADKGWRVILLVAGREVRILSPRRLAVAPTDPGPDEGLSAHAVSEPDIYDVSRHLSPMSRDITVVGLAGFEPATP